MNYATKLNGELRCLRNAGGVYCVEQLLRAFSNVQLIYVFV